MHCRELESAGLSVLLSDAMGLGDMSNQPPSALDDAPISMKLDTVTMRRQIRTLRQEINVLSLQVKELTDNQLLQDSLDRLLNGLTASSTWKHVYTAERHRLRQAKAERD